MSSAKEVSLYVGVGVVIVVGMGTCVGVGGCGWVWVGVGCVTKGVLIMLLKKLLASSAEEVSIFVCGWVGGWL